MREIDDITASIEHHLRRQHPPHHPPALRDAHPKHHGCVRATFTVADDVPAELRHGVFAEPRRVYPCWVRFSNALKVRHDLAPDARGMAVKLMGVEGSESGTQDWVMVSHDVFFTRDAREFVDFPAVVSDVTFKLRAWLRIAWFFLNPKAGPPRLKGLAALFRSLKPTWNPLAMHYFSQTPYRLGNTLLMKYSARPREARPLGRRLAIRFKALAYLVVSNFGGMKQSHDMLRESLIQRLREGDAAFDFYVQSRGRPDDVNERERIEDDALTRWSEQEFRFVKVAEIRVLKLGDDFDADAMMEFGQHLSFSPWHHEPAHEPVGSINRARKVVYARISDLRHELNRKVPREPLPEETPVDYLASIEAPS